MCSELLPAGDNTGDVRPPGGPTRVHRAHRADAVGDATDGILPPRTHWRRRRSESQRGQTGGLLIPRRPSFLSGLSLRIVGTLRGLEEGPQEVHRAEAQTENEDESERNAYEANNAQYHGRAEICGREI
jgi:hypothetical protein